MRLTKEIRQRIREERVFYSDSDSRIICLLIDMVNELEGKDVKFLSAEFPNLPFGDEDLEC